MISKSAVTLCLQLVLLSLLAKADAPKPCTIQLPFKPPAREPVDYQQRRGTPVRIKATRRIKVLAGESHKSKNNFVAVYIGLPVVDMAQDNVVIESVRSNMDDPSNIVFAPAGDSVLIEYFNVKPGFSDEISLTFSADIYERRTNLTGAKPYNTEDPLYKKYTKDRSYAGLTPAEGQPHPVLLEHLNNAGVRPQTDPVDKARKIYEYLGEKLSYGGFRDSGVKLDDIIKRKRAHCGEYTVAFVKLCREAGVPARRCAGFAFVPNTQNKKKTDVSGHNWAEFYVEGIGWIPVDPTMGDKNDLRKKYYFGALDNARLCVSKGGFHDRLPLWYKTKADGDIIFTEDALNFKPFKPPNTIQGVHRFQYRFDLPIHISVPNRYGPSLNVLYRRGEFIKPKSK